MCIPDCATIVKAALQVAAPLFSGITEAGATVPLGCRPGTRRSPDEGLWRPPVFPLTAITSPCITRSPGRTRGCCYGSNGRRDDNLRSDSLDAGSLSDPNSDPFVVAIRHRNGPGGRGSEWPDWPAV